MNGVSVGQVLAGEGKFTEYEFMEFRTWTITGGVSDSIGDGVVKKDLAYSMKSQLYLKVFISLFLSVVGNGSVNDSRRILKRSNHLRRIPDSFFEVYHLFQGVSTIAHMCP